MFIIKLEKKVKVYKYKNNSYYFYFNICNSQGQPLTTSEMYVSKQGATKCIASFRRNGLKFMLVDNTG